MTANESGIMCSVHNLQAIFICTVKNCKENRYICEDCKSRETKHFSIHGNYLYRVTELKQFESSKSMIPRLEKGINEFDPVIRNYKALCYDQIKKMKEDFNELRETFLEVANKFQKIYTENFEKETLKYDDKIYTLKQTLREYIQLRNEQDSFFSKLLHRKDRDNEDSIDNIITRNEKAFRVRAEIMTLRSEMAVNSNNNLKYKQSDSEVQKFMEMKNYFAEFQAGFYAKLKELFSCGDQENLQSSIVSETKSLAMSRVSTGYPLERDLRQSQVKSGPSFQKVDMPPMHPKVKSLQERLPVMTAPKNITFSGPFLYSAGVYHGQIENSKREYFGVFIFNDGSLYEGGWRSDKIHGIGRLIRSNCFYEGEVKCGKAHGKGNYEDEYRSYSGDWVDDKRSGLGEEQFKTKRKKYIGNFANDKYNGKGKLIDLEFVYEGKFKDGLFHGDGEINFKNREKFKGAFSEGFKTLGRHTYPDGSYYDGMFKENLPHGTGEFYWADGLIYSGQWANGFQDGVGVQTFQDGREMRGLWKGGKWQKWL